MARQKDPLAELKEEVEAAPGGAIKTNGERARIAAGITRLKAKARIEVGNRLRDAGMLAIPRVPDAQHKEVVIALVDSPVGRLYGAIEQADLDVMLKATKVVDSDIVRRVAGEELRGLIAEMSETVDEIESGESRD